MAKRPNELSAGVAARALAQGELTAEALARACLDRIAERDGVVQAWEAVEPERVLARARDLDRQGPAGVLFGLPFGIKDIIDTADLPTGHGSPIYAGWRPRADAACVALVREAGGVVLGKTVTTEFAFATPNRTRNPLNLDHTPGGSSSGSAAAVADRMVPLAYGTQTGGSVIRPASFCGVIGYKAGLGRLPTAGVRLFGQNLDSLGVFARRVADVALVRAALVGAPAAVPELGRPPRIGLCRTFDWEAADPAMQRATEAAAAALARAGAAVRDVAMPAAFAGLGEAHAVVIRVEGARNFAWERSAHPGLCSPGLMAKLAEGLATPHADYEAALALAERCRRDLDALFEDVDVLLAPSAVGEAPAGLGSTGDPLFNRVWTLLHAAAVSLPGHAGPNGLPLGVQAIAPAGHDDRLLAVAHWMEDRIA